MTPSDTTSSAKVGNQRYLILALLFAVIVVLYLDRTILSVLNPEFSVSWDWWNSESFGRINASFMFAYACGFAVAGRFYGRFGLRLGFACIVAAWAAAAASHALAGSVLGFMVARACLGFAEAGAFPGAIRTVAEWFPRKERAFATGLFNSGSNIGSFLAPTLIPWIYFQFGWRACFITAGALGVLWVVVWAVCFRMPAAHPRISAAELEYIRSDRESDSGAAVPARAVIGRRQFWAFVSGKALTDPVWFFLLFWTPKILSDKFHTNIKQNGLPLVIIAAMAVAGGIFGGWASSRLLARGRTSNFARKIVMLGCVSCVIPLVFVPGLEATDTNKWIAVGLIGLASGAHQGFSANLFTLVSDMFPKAAIATVVGLGSMMAAFAAGLAQLAAGHITKVTNGDYLPLFVGACVIYITGFAGIHLLAPKLERVAPAV